MCEYGGSNNRRPTIFEKPLTWPRPEGGMRFAFFFRIFLHALQTWHMEQPAGPDQHQKNSLDHCRSTKYENTNQTGRGAAALYFVPRQQQRPRTPRPRGCCLHSKKKRQNIALPMGTKSAKRWRCIRKGSWRVCRKKNHFQWIRQNAHIIFCTIILLIATLSRVKQTKNGVHMNHCWMNQLLFLGSWQNQNCGLWIVDSYTANINFYKIYISVNFLRFFCFQRLRYH